MTPQEKYKKNNMKQIRFELNKTTEAELIEWLNEKPNKQGYLKELIRKDIELQNKKRDVH